MIFDAFEAILEWRMRKARADSRNLLFRVKEAAGVELHQRLQGNRRWC